MTRDFHDKQLWHSVKPVISAEKDDKGRIKGLGTAFVCGQEGNTTYLLTCWHVVETIGENNLIIEGVKAIVIACGDDALDLALLAVDGLSNTEILGLSDTGHSDQPFNTFGYFWEDEKKAITDSRLLGGRLGKDRIMTSPRYHHVTGWELKIFVEDEVFDRIRDGYSGAPIIDPASGLVVAVISHKIGDPRGKAVDISNLRTIYTSADTLFDYSEEGEGIGGDPWIVKTLDHDGQIVHLRNRLWELGGPTVAVVEGCINDWPKYLADDIFLKDWPELLDTSPQEATTLDPTLYGEDQHALWSAMHRCLPASQQAVERSGEHDAVCAWLGASNRHVFYMSVSMTNDRWRLPRLIRAAQAFLAELSGCMPGKSLLMLIVCQPPHETSPWWWPLWRRYRLKRIPDVLWLKPLNHLVSNDLSNWYNRFSSDTRRILNRDKLIHELLDLFEDKCVRIRYQQVRKRLLEDGALEKAQKARIRR